MQREDYLLAWIRRYLRWLAEILGFVKVADYERALRRAETALRGLLNMGVDAALAADESELAARLALGEFSSETREKCLILAALFYQIGRAAAGKNDAALARRARLKALHILLGIRLRPDETALPDYLPSVERIVKELDGAPLPTRTAAAFSARKRSEPAASTPRRSKQRGRLWKRRPPTGRRAIRVDAGPRRAHYPRLRIWRTRRHELEKNRPLRRLRNRR